MRGIKDVSDSTGIADLATPSRGSERSDDELLLKVMCVEYVDQEGGPVVHVFGRERDGTLHHVEVDGHYPSFYAPSEAVGKRLENHYAVKETQLRDENGERYQDLYGNELTRIYCYQPESVGEVRELFDQTYEADVFFDKRWLIDKGIMTGVRIDLRDATTEPWVRGDVRVDDGAVQPVSVDETPGVEPRKLVFDIEVGSEEGVPKPETAEWPVTTIVAWDSYDDQYVGWLLRDDEHDLPGHDEMVDRADVDDLRVFDDESELLHDFNGFVEATRPDIVTGWFSNDFDIPYLIQRCENLNTYNYRDWSPLGDVWDGRFDPTIKGVEPIDAIGAYEKTQIHELDDKSLDGVAEKEVDETKVDLVDEDESNLDHTEMWRQRPVEFLRYNKVDVQLVREIDESVGAFDMIDNLRAVSGCSYSDPIGGNFDLMDIVFLRKADEYGYRLPTAQEPDVDDFHGGYVITPSSGLHQNVVYPDYSSLYPNMMYQCNISPETLVGTADDLADSDLTEDDCVWTYVDTETPPPQKSDVEIAPDEMTKLYFRDPDDREGFVRAVLDDIMGMCDRYEGAMYDAAKRVRNSCFTPDTDVLTPTGLVPITDIEVGDEVYSWNPDTNQMEVKPVVDTIERDRPDETIHHIDTNGIDLKVTSDHDMWVRRYRHTDDYEKVEAGALNEWTDYQLPHDWTMSGEERDSVNLLDYVDDAEVVCDATGRLRRAKSGRRCASSQTVHGRSFAAAVDWDGEHDGNGRYFLDEATYRANESYVRANADVRVHQQRGQSAVPVEYDADNFIRLLGWYVTEGSIYRSEPVEYESSTRGESTTINIAQYGDERRGEIRSLLDEMGLNYYDSGEDIQITGATTMADALDEMCGSGAYQKRLPEWVFDTSERQRRLLFETMMAGDGDDDRPRYTTASEALSEDVMRLLVSLGETPRRSRDSGVYRVTHRPDATNSFSVGRSVSTEQHDGSVYCVTVADNNTLVAGRNGNVSVVGNCYGVLGDSDTYGTGFRLFDWRLAEGTTLGGQRILRGGADKFVEIADEHGANAEIVGGDTDSVMTAFPDADSPEAALDTAMAVNDEMNDWLEEFAAEQFGLASADDARMELELESVASSLFFKGDDDGRSDDGVKKRYAQLIVWDEGNWISDPEPAIKGFEYVRSDVAQITTDVQYRTFEEILAFDSEAAEGRVKDFFVDLVTRVMKRDESVSRGALGIRFGISQPLSEYGSPDQTPQPQYRGAKFANQEIYGGDAIGEGDKPMYFYVHEGKTGPLRKTYDAATREDGRYVDAISVLDADDLPADVRVDREKMLTKTVVDPMEAIFRTLDWGTEWLPDAIEDAKPAEAYRDDGQMGFESFERDSGGGGGADVRFDASTFM
jgi:DNA polymerase I